MSYETIRLAVETKIADDWGSSIKQTAENVPFDAPTNGAWCRYSIRPADARNAEVGTGMQRYLGFVWFQIFLPVNEGARDAYLIADHIKAVLENKTLAVTGGGPIYLRVAECNYVGKDTASGGEQWRCVVPFQVDFIS